MKLRSRLIRSLPLLGAPLLLSGCWSSIELNNRAFVSTMIVDTTSDGRIDLTFGFPLTNKLIPGQTGGAGGGGGGGAQPAAFISRTGRTLEDAYQKLQGDLPRKITFGQTHSIILSNKFAEQGIAPILEFVTRNPFLRLNTNLFLVEGDAREKVARSPVFFERFFTSVLNGFVRNDQILITTVKDLMYSRANGGDRLIPILSFSNKNAMLPEDAPPSVGTAGSVMLREGKIVKPNLTPVETSAARSLLSQLSQYIYSIASPTDGKAVGFYTTSIKTRIKPVKTKDGLRIVIHSFSEAGVIGSDSDIDLNNESNLIKLQAAIKKSSDQSLSDTIAKTQRAGADVFNFALYISTVYPDEWSKIRATWRDYYRNKLQVEVKSDIALKRIGSSTQAFRRKFLESSAP